jgi:hypothetical protein
MCLMIIEFLSFVWIESNVRLMFVRDRRDKIKNLRISLKKLSGKIMRNITSLILMSNKVKSIAST